MTGTQLALKPAGGVGQRHPMRGVSYGVLARQKLDIYVPKAGARAIILFFQGGGWVSGARWRYRLLGQTLTRLGFACVVADYHLYPQARFPRFVEDAARAFSWTHEHAADIAGRRVPVFLMGHSAGAHISALLALDADYLRAQGLTTEAIAGVIGLAGPYTLDPLKWPGLKDIFAASAASPHSARPIKLARAGAPAMLLLHGTSDRVVKSDASVHLAGALTAAGSPARAKLYPGIGHLGVLTSMIWGLRWRASVLGDTNAFVSERLGGR